MQVEQQQDSKDQKLPNPVTTDPLDGEIAEDEESSEPGEVAEDDSGEDGSDEQEEGEKDDSEESEVSGDDDTEEVVVTIGEESPPEDEPAPGWVKGLRKKNRELEKELKRLRAEQSKSAENSPVVLGEKPKLEDYDYDSDVYEQKLDAWYQAKRRADEQEHQKRLEETRAQEEWQKTVDEYEKAKRKLSVSDFSDVEEVVTDTLSTDQQGMILVGADDPAVVIYALGKNPKRAKELASIKDPVKFAFAVAKLETQMKVTKRRAATQPEKTVKSGSARVSGSVDSTLDKYREEAARTGDFTKVNAYKRKLRDKGK